MADQPQPQGNHRGTSESCRRKATSAATGKQQQRTAVDRHLHHHQSSSTAASAPCGACKFLRRKCISGCIFAPHFGSDQGAARFAAVHKVFGASNVSKLLLHIPLNRRNDAVVAISYEAQARLSDPVYGCVSTILALQQQVASLQTELAMVQTQLINSRFAFANAIQSSQQHQEQQQNMALLQPAYSNNSSASTNPINMRSFTSNFNHDLAAETAPCSHSLEPLLLSRPSQDEEEDEQQSQVPHHFR
ncbi:putative transcription factor AS2-LOB family [Rosa chinensis]|uniref:Putative transcription factor AS2-LOB family n=1 Tax=Rosa chinensis TaxID=74649 RepID=A0A2P6RHE8_ROSCH|nr:LOB domain-containing protein 20 [Rosa chinensis]PRQ45858.1 putative transcription factor AS2-LOB family [Rosa chinensis]